MPQQSLQEEEINAVLQEQSRARMAKHMGRQTPFQSGSVAQAAQVPADSLCRPWAGEDAAKRRTAALRQLGEQIAQGRVDNVDPPLAASLAADVESAGGGVQIDGSQGDELAHA